MLRIMLYWYVIIIFLNIYFNAANHCFDLPDLQTPDLLDDVDVELKRSNASTAAIFSEVQTELLGDDFDAVLVFSGNPRKTLTWAELGGRRWMDF